MMNLEMLCFNELNLGYIPFVTKKVYVYFDKKIFKL